MNYDFAVIGAGASGFMAAIIAAEKNPQAKIVIFEKSQNILAKVKISGGGRCNVTNAEKYPKQFSKNYPRGEKFVLKLFDKFSPENTKNWFKNKGLDLKIEPDGRMFPVSNSSQSVVDLLVAEANKLNVAIKTSFGVADILAIENGYKLQFNNNETCTAKNILVATGGGPSIDSYKFLQNFDLKIVSPIPSLFTFNASETDITALSGLSVSHAKVKLVSQNVETEGPLLITHWGFSGPAILRMSAWAAVILNDHNYNFKILVNWAGHLKQPILINEIQHFAKENPKKQIQNYAICNVPQRLWVWLCNLCEINAELRWIDIAPKQQNKLIENICNCSFTINGKSTFKEEFVTCGGISLDEIDVITMQSKKYPGLYFSGEVVDIDAITGGFNFQAAWSSGYVVGSEVLV